MKITRIITGTIETTLELHSKPLSAPEGVFIEVPVSCFLIEHNDHKIIFDAGQMPLQNVQERFKVPYYIKVTREETLYHKLKAMNIAPGDIDFIIISHAHSDHCAGLIDFPQVKVIAQAPAAEALKRFGNEIIVAGDGYDVTGDGAVICIDAPGHAPGHQCLLLTDENNNRSLLTADTVYLPEALDYEPSPQEYQARKEYFDSIKKVRGLRDSGVNLIFSHEPHRVLAL